MQSGKGLYMEIIKIKGKAYPIKTICLEAEHLLFVEFSDELPKAYEGLKVYTAGDVECADFAGYTTVYRQDEGKVWLSDDGSTYTVPDTSPPEPYEPSVEALKKSKQQEINAACTQIIHAGVDVELSDGKTEHFSLTETDQLNLFGLRAQITSGESTVPYHADRQPCRFYSAEDMEKIIDAAMKHAAYHTTYCNAMHMWIAAASKDELRQITYGVDVPEEYQSDVLKVYRAQITEADG